MNTTYAIKLLSQVMFTLKPTKGWLPQAGLIANELLKKRLNEHGYHQTKLIPGLWTHDT